MTSSVAAVETLEDAVAIAAAGGPPLHHSVPSRLALFAVRSAGASAPPRLTLLDLPDALLAHDLLSSMRATQLPREARRASGCARPRTPLRLFGPPSFQRSNVLPSCPPRRKASLPSTNSTSMSCSQSRSVPCRSNEPLSGRLSRCAQLPPIAGYTFLLEIAGPTPLG